MSADFFDLGSSASYILLKSEDKCSSEALEVAVASLSLAFILGFGIPQLWFRKGASAKVEDGKIRELPVSRSGQVQVTLCFAMAALALLKTLLHRQMALTTVNSAIAWPVVAALLLKEQKSRTYNQGHTLALKAFWVGSFVYQNIKLFLLLEPSAQPGGLTLALGIAEYFGSGLVLFLGLHAPGLVHEEEEVDEDDWVAQREARRQKARDVLKLGPRLQMLTEVLWANRSSFLRMKLAMAVCAATLAVQRILNVYEPLYSSYVFNSMNEAIGQMQSGKNQTEEGAGAEKLKVRWDYLLISAGLHVTHVLALSLQDSVWQYFQLKMEKHFDFQYMHHLHKLSLHWHQTHRSTSLYDRGTTSVCKILDYVVFSIIPAAFDMGIAVVFLTSTVNGRFCLVVFVTTLLHQFALSSPISEYHSYLWNLKHQFFSDSWRRIVESISHNAVVKIFTNEKFELDRYGAGTLEGLEKSKKLEYKAVGLDMVDALAAYFGTGFSTFLLVNLVSSGGLAIGDYYLVDSYLRRVRGSFCSVRHAIQPMLSEFVELESMVTTLKEEPDVNDAEDAKDLEMTIGTIEFKNVSFGYPEVPVLKDLSFVAPGGKTLAIVGQSGCGKTTIMKLIMRLYDVASGQILIDGQDVKEVLQVSLRKQIGSVPQETDILYSQTLRDNIRYADVTASDDQVVIAAKKAYLHEKIMKLPKNYESKFDGNQGINLSGGETQRIGIARAMLKNPKIVLLDEATSSMDSKTERQLQKSLHKLCKSRTCIIVAHRLSTVRHAHNIIVLSTEGIVEQGTHDELVAKNGLYAEMWNVQLGNETNPEEDASEESAAKIAD